MKGQKIIMSKKKVNLINNSTEEIEVAEEVVEEVKPVLEEVKVEETKPVVEEIKPVVEEVKAEESVVEIRENKIDPIPQVVDTAEPVVAYVGTGRPHINVTAPEKVEAPVVEETPVKVTEEPSTGEQWFIQINEKELDENKRKVYESRLDRYAFPYTVSAEGIILVGPVANEREAIVVRKKLIGKGMKGKVVHNFY